MGDFPIKRGLTAQEIDEFVQNFDHHDPRFGQDPYPVLQRMVRECPIKHSSNYGGFWVFTGFEQVRWGYQNYELLSSVSVSVPSGQGNPRPMIPVEIDPPLHSKYRSLLAPVFAPARIGALETEIRAICTDLIDSFIEKGECEFITQLAQPLPTRMFVKMLGIPPDEADTFKHWNHAILHGVADDPDGTKRAATGQAARSRLRELLELRKRQRSDDIISILIDSEVDGESLDDEHLLDIAYLLFLAGLDTVQGAVGFQFAFLASHPEHRDRLVADPPLIPEAIEELLRWESVVIAGRVATHDFEYEGFTFKKGDRVVLVDRAADRDPRAFDDPDAVNFDRTGMRHVAFAVGPHRCVGSHLARLEMKVVHEEMHRRIPDYRLKEGTVVTTHGGNVAGLDELWLEWRN